MISAPINTAVTEVTGDAEGHHRHESSADCRIARRLGGNQTLVSTLPERSGIGILDRALGMVVGHQYGNIAAGTGQRADNHPDRRGAQGKLHVVPDDVPSGRHAGDLLFYRNHLGLQLHQCFRNTEALVQLPEQGGSGKTAGPPRGRDGTSSG